jgi:homoserine O-succinyltransferase
MAVEQFFLSGEGGGTVLEIGLVNDMPDDKLRGAELQFASLLKAAAGALEVRLHLFSTGLAARGPAARARMEGFYADTAALPQARLDALIVSGESPGLPALVEWTQEGVISALFSCQAAHAAVLHLDGIEPAALPQKLSGVFASERVAEDALLFGLPAVHAVPHSRRHGLAEADLRARGYRVLTRVPYGDPDLFAKPGRSLTLFLQGRPEYGAAALAREFLQDTASFLRGESGERPAMPENYFDRATEEILHDLAGHAVDAAILPRYRALLDKAIPLQDWRGSAVRLFANWLTLVAAEKTRRAIAGRPARRRLRAVS